MEKFVVGKRYIWPGLYGPRFDVECVARTEKTASFVEVGYHYEPVSVDIEVDIRGEIGEAWNYSDNKGHIKSYDEEAYWNEQLRLVQESGSRDVCSM